MAKLNMNLILLIGIVVASMEFQGSKAQNTHIVGDGFGWAVPQNDGFYAKWASQQTFHVNDVLLFNFATGLHTVAEVTKEAYNKCDGQNPISLATTGPAKLTINTPGDHFYICTIEESKADNSDQVQGSKAQNTHIVGDGFGWAVPQNDGFYAKWASQQTFHVNDVLLFNFATGLHTVAEVTKEAYNNCDGQNPILLATTGPAKLTINTPGDHFYICTIGPHCNFFLKLAIKVVG
ncbi:hypothetical protein OSB04_021217 [Centaurea solstitialis]|uniref:Phytocyanin domain-containing protein n=1 Tax=Centaurea solstitialis TaxID=347529 RepID=A0AA38WG13_9ASTR|nr:hypothetical protein OSB04_021217 [Centaurea solstitialis]